MTKKSTLIDASDELRSAFKELIVTICTELKIDKAAHWATGKLSKSTKTL